jgi:hypothetical protein
MMCVSFYRRMRDLSYSLHFKDTKPQLNFYVNLAEFFGEHIDFRELKNSSIIDFRRWWITSFFGENFRYNERKFII